LVAGLGISMAKFRTCSCRRSSEARVGGLYVVAVGFNQLHVSETRGAPVPPERTCSMLNTSGAGRLYSVSMTGSPRSASVIAKHQPMSKEDYGGDPGHLIALYAAERSELTALYLASIGVLAFGATVLGAAGGLIVTADDLPRWVPLVVPVPFCAIVLYHTLVAALAKTRQLSTEMLEAEIVAMCGTVHIKASADQILSRAGARVLNLTGGNLRFAIANLICNSVIVLTGIGFVAFSLYKGYDMGVPLGWLVASIVVNGSLLTISTVLLISGHLGTALEIAPTPETVVTD